MRNIDQQQIYGGSRMNQLWFHFRNKDQTQVSIVRRADRAKTNLRNCEVEVEGVDLTTKHPSSKSQQFTMRRYIIKS